MQAGTKAGLALAATFILGAVTGVLGGGAWQQRRNPPPMPGNAPDGFVSRMERTIQPRDSAQRAAILPLLVAGDARNRRVVDGAREQMRASNDSLAVQLAPLLDDAQRERVREVVRGRGNGPPPGLGGRGDGRGRPPGR